MLSESQQQLAQIISLPNENRLGVNLPLTLSLGVLIGLAIIYLKGLRKEQEATDDHYISQARYIKLAKSVN